MTAVGKLGKLDFQKQYIPGLGVHACWELLSWFVTDLAEGRLSGVQF